MKIFVHLRHWELLLILVVPFFLSSYFLLQPFGFLMNALALFILLAWTASIRIIGGELSGQVQSDTKWIYWLLVLMPSVYMAFFGFVADDMIQQGERFPAWLAIPHLLSMGCIFFLIFSAAKTIQSLRLGKVATFGYYFGYGMAIWFFPIGIWFVQPRVNELIGKGNAALDKQFRDIEGNSSL